MLVEGAMFAFLTRLLLVARSRLKSRASLEAENLVLRQQVIVLSRKSRSRVRLRNIDRLIFVWLYRFFPAILNAITVAKPETVILWHRCGFRVNWRWKSRRRGGRPKIDREIRDLIRRMSKENPLWGSAADCSLPKTLSRMTRGRAYGSEAADGRVSDPAAACYPVAVHGARAA